MPRLWKGGARPSSAQPPGFSTSIQNSQRFPGIEHPGRAWLLTLLVVACAPVSVADVGIDLGKIMQQPQLVQALPYWSHETSRAYDALHACAGQLVQQRGDLRNSGAAAKGCGRKTAMLLQLWLLIQLGDESELPSLSSSMRRRELPALCAASQCVVDMEGAEGTVKIKDG
eukprot:CAMPEP_0115131704 /NCGR_PEP_ID=MMETSP0227-20121206/53284_1 /TAXON_ID=89957 /ORGANISM="Polarella glacialis, Strain CCMP 1383" /LENGTH=170 /DNA_ID=CAMNT_0002537293 /DNA_START=413 /DNA_END=926 /DNA_ORIENTATION=-